MNFCIALTLAPGVAAAATLSVEAQHDVPGPVEARAQGWDSTCTELFNSVMVWPDNDDTFGTKTLTIPSSTETIRFTFFNDYCGPGCPGDHSTDRNFVLDYFDVDGGQTEGEDFSRSYGPDPNYPGCGVGTEQGRTVAACGNEGDWVEYGPPCPESSCTDSVDNNNDGYTDCEDVGCDGVVSCEYGAELTCNDAFDNDADGDADCDDADCCQQLSCDGVSSCEYGTELTCNDAFDNDGDTDTDCADVDCDGVSSCEYGTELTCNDAFDNDADTDTDCADVDCDGVGSCEYGTELSCNDAFDNDADTDTDCADVDCDGVGSCEGTELTCDDAFDNDGDGRADCLDADCLGTAECPTEVAIGVVFQDAAPPGGITILPGDPGPGCGLASTGYCMDVILETSIGWLSAGVSVQYEDGNGLAVGDLYQLKGFSVGSRFCGPVGGLVDNGPGFGRTKGIQSFHCAVSPPAPPPPVAPPGTYRIGTIVWDTSGTHWGGDNSVTIAAFIDTLVDGFNAVINGNVIVDYPVMVLSETLNITGGEPSPVPSVSATGLAALGAAVLGIGIVGLVIAARRRLN